MSKEKNTSPDFDALKELLKVFVERKKEAEIERNGLLVKDPWAWVKPKSEPHGHWFGRLFKAVRDAGSQANVLGIIRDSFVGNPVNRWQILSGWEQVCQTYERQLRCKHLKGGRVRLNRQKDYAVRFHTFIDGSQSIKCQLCGKEVWNTPKTQFLWQHMLAMTEYSTNSPSSSEQPMVAVVFGNTIVEEFNNSPAGLSKLKAKYPLWDGTINPAREGLTDATKPVVVCYDPVFGVTPGKFQAYGFFNGLSENNPPEIPLKEGESPIRGAK